MGAPRGCRSQKEDPRCRNPQRPRPAILGPECVTFWDFIGPPAPNTLTKDGGPEDQSWGIGITQISQRPPSPHSRGYPKQCPNYGEAEESTINDGLGVVSFCLRPANASIKGLAASVRWYLEYNEQGNALLPQTSMVEAQL